MENMEIIEAIRSGNKDVIKSVYKDHAKDVYNFAKSITGDHDSAMEATKKTFVNLFTSIQKGENPTNIRLTALKMAYDEACRITLPSTANIDSPFDRNEEDAQPETEEVKEETAQVSNAEASETEISAPQADIVPEEVSETKEVYVEETVQEEIVQEASDPAEEEEPDTVFVSRSYEEVFQPADEEKIGNTQVFSIKEALGEEDGVEMDEVDEDEDVDDDDEYDDDEYEDVPRSKVGTVFIVIINIILVLLLIWLLYGLLVSFNVIPDVIHAEITYDWFNEHIYPIF